MPETFSTQLAELSGYADRNASLPPAEALRGRATRRTWQRRGGAAALAGGGAVAIAAAVSLGSLGGASTGVATSARPIAASSATFVKSPVSAQLTAYQTTLLAKAGVTKANLAVLKKLHLTPLQIRALGVAYAEAHYLASEGSGKQLTVAEIASAVGSKLTVAQIAALGYANMTVGQIEAIAKADLSAAQLAALGG